MPKYCSILQQYLDFHNKYTNIYGEKTIILMLVGSFYEIYSILPKNDDEDIIGPDLYKLSDILNIYIGTKHSSTCDYNMIGVPDYVLDKYRNILLHDNYTLVIVDQITPAPNPERDVVEIISSSTIIDNFDKKDSHYLVSLFINSFSNNTIYKIGLSAIDISTGVNYVHNITSKYNEKDIWKDDVYRLIHYYDPTELIIHTDNLNFKSSDYITWWNIDNLFIDFITDKIFYKPTFHETYLNKIFKNDSSISIFEYTGLGTNFEVNMSYIFMIEFIYQHKTQNISDINLPIIKNDENYLKLTNNTLYQLYITDNYIHKKERFNSLFDLLNKCKTSIGRRYLKLSLLYPIINKDNLNKRYDQIEYFQKDNLSVDCRKYLTKVLDIEKYHRKINLQIITPQEFYNFHISYKNILKISKILKSPISKDIDTIINHYSNIYDLESLNLQKLNNFDKSIFINGIYPDLDQEQSNYDNYKNSLLDIKNKLAWFIDKNNLDTIKISHNDKFGWLLVLTENRTKTLKSKLNNLTNPIIKFNNELSCNISDIKFSKKGANHCISIDIIDNISNNLVNIHSKIHALTLEYFKISLKDIYIKFKDIWNDIVSFTGNTDLYSTIALVSSENVYTRPIILNDEKSCFYAKDLRHPIVEKVNDSTEYIPNDIDFCENGILLFGTNACGKSTLMKSVGISLIMAQAGFFVPCSKLEFVPYTQIFTRILNNDNLFKSQSSFAVEMSELRNILLKADNKSMILGDELCSGTENISALCIVSQGLLRLSNLKSSFIFTSHLHQITNISCIQNLPNLSIKHLKIIYDEINDILIYDRKLIDGSGPEIYGIEVCKAMGLDNDFISGARQIQIELTGMSHTFLDTKKSTYNSSIVIDKCKICDNKAEETHHIKPQKDANEINIIDHHHKNIKHNLIPLCKKCHHDVTFNKLIIKGYLNTSKGLKIDYEYVSPTKKRKFTDEQIKIIQQYLSDIHNKNLSKTSLIKLLDDKHNIKISFNILNKILTNTY